MAQTQNNSEPLSLEVFGREKIGKSAAFRARKSNRVPAVVYGPKIKTGLNVTVSPRDLRLVYLKAGKTGLVTLKAGEGAPKDLEGSKILFKEIQTHPLRDTLLHVDMHQLDLARAIRVTVPLNFTGKAKGLSEGGIMSIVSRQVEVRCLPTEIPSAIDVDVSELGVNESIHLEELSKKYEGSKLEFIFENNIALVAIVPPEEEKAATPEVAATADAAATAATPAAGGAVPAAAPAAAPAGDKKGK